VSPVPHNLGAIRLAVFAITTAIAFVSAAWGGLPSAAAPMTKGQAYPAATHSWFVMPALGGREFVLAHVPPRSMPDGSARPSTMGLYRSAIRLTEVPEALAAWDDSVYAIFTARGDGSGDGKARTVRTLKAQRFSDSDLWVDQPSGRMDTLPSLAGTMKLAGFAAGPDGPLALLTEEPGGEIRLLALHDRAWRSVELPGLLVQSQRERGFTGVDLFADAEGIYVVARQRDAWTIWSGPILKDEAGKGSPETERDAALIVDWKMSRVNPFGVTALDTGSTVMRVDSRWYAVTSGDSATVQIVEVAPEFVRRVAAADDVGPVRAIVPVDGLARLVIVSTNRPVSGAEAKSAPPSQGAKVVELSLLTGRVFYSGPAQPLDPLGSGEFRFIAVGLILAMALILVLVLRAEEQAGLHLPDGFSFAEPTRRTIATILDFAIVALLVPRFTGNSILELFGPMAWLNGEAFETLLLVAILGCFVGTVGETLFGRTPGKLLADCEVISIAPRAIKDATSEEIPRPSFAASLTRNAIKWFLFPVALVALMDGSGRHRGDQFAKAAVVVPFDPEEESNAPDDEF
jgi:hypothetical protein